MKNKTDKTDERVGVTWRKVPPKRKHLIGKFVRVFRSSCGAVEVALVVSMKGCDVKFELLTGKDKGKTMEAKYDERDVMVYDRVEDAMADWKAKNQEEA